MFLEDKSKFPQVEPKADPFTLDSLIAWLETKDPVEEYVWFNLKGSCLLSQYSCAHGGSPWYVKHFGGEEKCQPFENMAFDRPHTFGAALTRARSIKAGT